MDTPIHYSMLIEWSDEDQAYIVSFPEWEAAGLIGHTHGDRYADAVQQGEEMLRFLIESAHADGDPIQEPAVVDYQHVARCCRFECLQEGIDAAGMPGGTDTTGQAAARHHTQHVRAQTRNALGPWDLGAYTRVGQVGCGEGCEPLLHHVVVHDDDSSPWVVAGLMMDWPGLPAGSSAGIGHIDGLRRGALCLQERVG